MDSPNSRIEPSLLLPYLQVLRLESLNEMSRVWKCSNWNAFLIHPPQHHQPQQLPFQNLTEIYLIDCHKVKYLFSPLMAKYLSNLKYVGIRECDGVEEVMSSRDDEHKENTKSSTSLSHQNITLFPNLDALELQRLSCLQSVHDRGDHTRSWRDTISSGITNTTHDQLQSGQVIDASWLFCQYPKRIHIESCEALGSLIPWYAVGQMERLQELEIKYCETLIEIFETQTRTNDAGDAYSGDNIGTILKITKVLVPQLSNLKVVSIIGCVLLPHIFTFSTLESLKQLNKLIVKRCEAIQVIVKEGNGTSSQDMQVLPSLQTLELDDLPNLKGFFLGVNEFTWPSLDDVMINACPQLTVFTSSESKTPNLKYIRSSIGKHTLDSCGLNFQTTTSDATSSKQMSLSFHNLIEINIEWAPGPHVIPSHSLLHLQKLETIHLKDGYDVKEVFEVELAEGRYNNISGFDESQTTIVEVPNLTQVNLESVHGLKYLWKSTQWMALKFPNLTTVDIQECHKLEHVFTSSMVGSLVQLQDLSISICANLEVIVKEEDKKESCDGKGNDIMIMLPHLKSLKLDYLSSLKGFCLGTEAFSMPALDTLQIERCRAITVFTKGYLYTPKLGKYYMKPDLNSFIKTKQ